MTNFAVQFIIDFVKRFAAKTPWFFKVVQYLSILTWAITGLPELLSYLCTSSNGLVCLDIPAAWEGLHSTAVSIASIVSIFISQLAVKTEDIKFLKVKE